MSGENRSVVYYNSKILYHIILFFSFVGALLLKEIIQSEIIKRLPLTNNLLIMGASFLVMYVAAIYVFPELGFLIARNLSK